MLADTFAAAWAPAARALQFWTEIVPGPEAEIAWHTPNEVLHDGPHYRLRRFAPSGAPVRDDRPVLIVPPEINGSNLCDYGPDQSLVRVLQDQGFGAVHAIEWCTATAATKDLDVDDSIRAIHRCADALGGRVHLIGICQGGWEAAVATALRPALAHTLTLAAAPIDFRAGDGPLTRLVDATPPSVYAMWVALGGGVMRGELLRAGFTNLKFVERRLLDRWQLWNRLDDEPWMERRHRMGRWYHAKKDLPGRAYLRIVQELFRENRLVAGTFRVLGEDVDLARVTCPLALVAGSQDHITLPEQLWAAEAACRPARTRRFVADAGHVGVVIRHDVERAVWPAICAWLQEDLAPTA
jgi:poly(3-hydroxybutyrate) depolymerase